MKTFALLLVAMLGVPCAAHAFCGFYVTSADARPINGATMVVLMRVGQRTVLSMQNDYNGPPEDFAIVIPVPVVLQRENVRTLPREVFERIDRLASPRLVEYWEQDPCTPLAADSASIIGQGAGTGSGYGRGAGGLASLVRVEAQFAVGEYDIVILSALDSNALDAWLRGHRYHIPEGAADVLRPYVARGTKFFVAKVNVGRVRFANGRAVLSPLRFYYDGETFELPIRLGLLSSSGTQDLVVHVLAPGERYEVANHANVTIPTNLDVADSVRTRFGTFYAALFDETVRRNPGAVVTEYAWQATGCDPCPGPVLSEEDIATLGSDVAFAREPAPTGPRSATVPQVRIAQPVLMGGLQSAEVVRRTISRHVNELRFCYESSLNTRPTLAGEMHLTGTIDPRGAVTSASTTSTRIADPRMDTCIRNALRRWTFPTAAVPTQIDVPITFQLGGFVGRANAMVLTRLHFRYGRDTLGDDLVLRVAPAIVGGRERPDPSGKLEEGARPDSYNNFQARYAIRHAWTGAVACEHPVRGVWGGPPAGATAPAQATQAATDVGHVPRGGVRLADFVRSPLPSLGLTGAATPPTAPPPTPAARPPAATTHAPQGGGGCTVRPGTAAAAWLALPLALSVAAVRRRRRARSR